jgi:preprotein translocase subunit SecB
MTKDPKSSAEKTEASSDDNKLSPAIRILGQYVKDLSFENPNAPGSLTTTNPEIGVTVNVGARPIADQDFEVEIKLEVKANKEAKAIFMAELSYCGVFRLEGVPENMLQPVLLIEGPRLLFPFARQVLADVTRDGGFPPVMLDPIDFTMLFQKRQGANGMPN